MDIGYILVEKYGKHGASFSLVDNNYETLEWFSEDVPKPTLEEIQNWSIEVKNKAKLKDLRNERNKKLLATDWITLRSYSQGIPVPQEWAEYQQALRDITDTYTSLDDVVWPTKPNAV